MRYNGIKVIESSVFNEEKGELWVKLADGTTAILTKEMALSLEEDQIPSLQATVPVVTETVSPEEGETEEAAPKRRGRPKKA